MPYSSLAETGRSSLGDPDSPAARMTYDPGTAQVCTDI